MVFQPISLKLSTYTWSRFHFLLLSSSFTLSLCFLLPFNPQPWLPALLLSLCLHSPSLCPSLTFLPSTFPHGSSTLASASFPALCWAHPISDLSIALPCSPPHPHPTDPFLLFQLLCRRLLPLLRLFLFPCPLPPPNPHPPGIYSSQARGGAATARDPSATAAPGTGPTTGNGVPQLPLGRRIFRASLLEWDGSTSGEGTHPSIKGRHLFSRQLEDRKGMPTLTSRATPC